MTGTRRAIRTGSGRGKHMAQKNYRLEVNGSPLCEAPLHYRSATVATCDGLSRHDATKYVKELKSKFPRAHIRAIQGTCPVTAAGEGP